MFHYDPLGWHWPLLMCFEDVLPCVRHNSRSHLLSFISQSDPLLLQEESYDTIENISNWYKTHENERLKEMYLFSWQTYLHIILVYIMFTYIVPKQELYWCRSAVLVYLWPGLLHDGTLREGLGRWIAVLKRDSDIFRNCCFNNTAFCGNEASQLLGTIKGPLPR